MNNESSYDDEAEGDEAYEFEGDEENFEENEEEGEEVQYYAERPNKSGQKRELSALFEMGEEMSKLSDSQLSLLNLPEKIQKAVAEVAKMPLKGARKRQLKFIAGQLYKMDLTAIQEKLARLKNKSAHGVREHHLLERWRDRLMLEGDIALTELLEEQPLADRQQLRQLIRAGQKETAMGKPPKSSRQIYRYLKELFNFEDDIEVIELDQNPEDKV
ncbi:MAG: ribosome biogenesis factor YjgA [Methylococcaceae bacterium]|jgi:ribosome-associated protein